jgi:SAM-dependent methyltransferase
MTKQADGPMPGSFVDLSGEYGGLACFQSLPPLVVMTNAHTYLSKRDAADLIGTTWLSLALEGLENLRRRACPRVRSAAVLGTGGGLDAIGISHLFSPDEIVASDIHPRALEAARWNIARFARAGTRCDVRQSDLFRQYPNGDRFDLVFENLPNVPGDSELLTGTRTASCYDAASYPSDPIADRQLLALHYACLLESRARLRPNGWIVCMLGGRVPWEAIRAMFARAGYAATVLHFGLKTQTEAELVIPGYAGAEENGSESFRYYHPIPTCREILHRRSRTDSGTASRSTGIPDLSPESIAAVNEELESYRVSANTAWSLHRRGERVCHTVYVVGGTTEGADSRGRA